MTPRLLPFFLAATFGAFVRAAAALIVPDELPLGELTPDRHEIVIPIRNDGPETKISQIDVDCDCLTLDPAPLTVKANGELRLHGTLDLRRTKPGRAARLVLIQSGGQSYFITVTAVVTTSRTWEFEETLHLTARAGGRAEMTTAFRRRAGGTGSLVSAVSSERWLTATLRPSADGFEIAYLLGPTVPEGRTRANVTIRTDDPGEPPIVQRIEVEAPENFRLDPADRYIANGKIGQQVAITIQADHWDRPNPPVFMVDGEAAEILRVKREAETGGFRWQIALYPRERGISERKIRVVDRHAGEFEGSPSLAELPVVMRVVE